jgi:hypothetical protein
VSTPEGPPRVTQSRPVGGVALFGAVKVNPGTVKLRKVTSRSESQESSTVPKDTYTSNNNDNSERKKYIFSALFTFFCELN